MNWRRGPDRPRVHPVLGVVVFFVAACTGSSVATVGPSVLPSATSVATGTANPSTAIPSPSAASTPAPSSGPSASPSPLASLRAATGIVLDASDETYRVTGTTASALVAGMRAEALKDRVGESAFAITTWDMTWSYGYNERSGSCSIQDLVVQIRISVLMPFWEPPPGTDAGLIARWNGYIDALRRHERGHEQNGLDRAKEVRDAMLALPPRSTCTALERTADAAGAAVIDAGNDWDRTYDDDTDHGATQGAVFP